MSRRYRPGCRLLLALFAGACSGTPLDSESVGARDEGLTAVPMPAVSATYLSPECLREWMVEAPGVSCPAAFPLQWSYGRVMVPSLTGQRYCTYISRSPNGNRNGPFPGGIQAPLRADCAYASRGQVPSAAPLASSDCNLSKTCNLPYVEGPHYPPNAGGGPPVYFNSIGRTLWALSGVTRVRLRPSVTAVSTGNAGLSPADPEFSQYEISGEGLYQLTDCPSDVGEIDYMVEDGLKYGIEDDDGWVMLRPQPPEGT